MWESGLRTAIITQVGFGIGMLLLGLALAVVIGRSTTRHARDEIGEAARARDMFPQNVSHHVARFITEVQAA